MPKERDERDGLSNVHVESRGLREETPLHEMNNNGVGKDKRANYAPPDPLLFSSMGLSKEMALLLGSYYWMCERTFGAELRLEEEKKERRKKKNEVEEGFKEEEEYDNNAMLMSSMPRSSNTESRDRAGLCTEGGGGDGDERLPPLRGETLLSTCNGMDDSAAVAGSNRVSSVGIVTPLPVVRCTAQFLEGCEGVSAPTAVVSMKTNSGKALKIVFRRDAKGIPIMEL